MSTNRDEIYKSFEGSDFVFDDRVADVFPDMINRSVPGYAAIVKMIGVLTEKYAQAGTNLYDLGCSLGASTLSMRSNVDVEDCRIIAVDNSEAMIKRCQRNIERDHTNLPVDLLCDDIQNITVENASVVVLNFTLQFVKPDERIDLINGFYNGLKTGGILVLSEKIRFEDSEEAVFQETLHHTFKSLNGYSDMEISRKRNSLENVLIPDSLATHRKRLEDAGFSKVFVWFQCFNFVSMVAVK